MERVKKKTFMKASQMIEHSNRARGSYKPAEGQHSTVRCGV